MKAFWITDEKEKPLDTLVKDGGFCGIFRRIGCVGDSLSSGEYEIVNEDGTKSENFCRHICSILIYLYSAL